MTANSVLELFPLRIPGWKPGAPASIDAEGGIPLALTYLYPDKGVKVVVDPYVQQEVDDTQHLILNDIEVDVAIVESKDKTTTLYLPVRALLDGLNIIHYEVRRGSENLDSSTPLRAWFHKQRPALKDLEGNHEWHSQMGIDILPSSAKDDGVDPDQAREGVICTASYPLTRPFDRIRVRCAGERIEHEVSEDEALAGGPIQIRIDEAVFKKIGDTPNCIVTYTVWDWIGNSVDLDALWSAAIVLFVSLNGTWFEPPLVSEDPNDSSDDPDSIDLAKLAGQPAIAQVHAQRAWLKADIIEMTCTFTSATGSIEVLVLKETVDRAPFIYKLPVPYAPFPTAVGGSATFKYKLWRSGQEVGRSFTTRIDIIGEASTDLPLVTIVGAPGLVIDPLNQPDGLTARVEFLSTQPGDQCQLLARPVTSDRLPVFPARPFNVNKRVNNLLTIADLVARHDTVLRLPWELTRNGVKTRSKPALLKVRKIDDEDPRLSRPKVVQAPDDKVLDLTRFEGHAEVKVLPWLGIRAGQVVELTCVGVDGTGADYIVLTQTSQVTPAEVTTGLSAIMLRSRLSELRNDSPLKVRFSVQLGQAIDISRPVLFPVLELNVVVAPPVSFEGFESGVVGAKPVGTVMDFPAMTVTVVRGSVQLGANGSSYAPPITLKYLYIAPGATLRFTLKTAARTVRFGIADSSRIPSSVQCYDENGQLIVSRSTPSYGGGYQVWADYAGTAIQKIKIIDITDGGGDSFLDNFTMQY